MPSPVIFSPHFTLPPLSERTSPPADQRVPRGLPAPALVSLVPQLPFSTKAEPSDYSHCRGWQKRADGGSGALPIPGKDRRGSGQLQSPHANILSLDSSLCLPWAPLQRHPQHFHSTASSWQLLGPRGLVPGPAPPLSALCISKGQHQSDSQYHLQQGLSCWGGEESRSPSLAPFHGDGQVPKRMAVWATEPAPGQPVR